jgi:hypothetical protein
VTSRERAAFALAALEPRQEPSKRSPEAAMVNDLCWFYLGEGCVCAVVAESLSLDGMDHRRVP